MFLNLSIKYLWKDYLLAFACFSDFIFNFPQFIRIRNVKYF